jgi:hypothetical protein
MFAAGTNSAVVLPSADVRVIESNPSADPGVVGAGTARIFYVRAAGHNTGVEI